MGFIASSLISVHHKELKKLRLLMAVPPKTKAMYDNDNSIETVQGRAREDLVISLVRLLQGVKDAWLAESGSEMDVNLLADVAIQLEDDRCFILQVKFSKPAAQKHTIHKIKYKGKNYPSSSCVWFKDFKPRALLSVLSTGLNLPIDSDTMDAVKLASKLKGKLLPYKMLNLSTKQLQALSLLNYTQIRGSDIQF